MKHTLKHIALCSLVAVGAGMGLSSCDDFLTITPTDRIVEEEFWQDKKDLNNAVTACYWRMISGDLMAKYVYWGEERSDNVERSTTVSASGPVANIMNANLLPTYDQFNWTSMYNVINYCNKVLAHGPEVIESDESFSENDWKPIHAEIITLRALCHFYLVRTFGEIPYITEDYNNDSQELRASQSTQLTVLNNIISDLESIKNDAQVDYGNTVENKGRITKKTVCALLADVYLWRASYKAGNNHPFTKVTTTSNYAGEKSAEELAARGTEDYGTSATEDYQQCIANCDQVIQMTINEKKKALQKRGLVSNMNVELEDLLEQNVKLGQLTTRPAHAIIFGTGNSDESIFELQIDGTSNTNSMITSNYWNIKDAKAGALAGAVALLENVEIGGPNTLSPSYIYTKTDYRMWENLRWTGQALTAFDIWKFSERTVTQSNDNFISRPIMNNASLTGSDKITVYASSRPYNNVDANWIVYRMSEIFLMKAEAMSQVYSDDTNLKAAFDYVREVFKRSNPWAYEKTNPTGRTDSLDYTQFNTQAGIERLVMDERQREFFGEGKRWFDLVRFAQRRGNTADMLTILTRKYTNTKQAIQAKLADMQALFSPIYHNEIKNNNLLYQNGVWSVNETSSRTDEL